MRLLLLSMQQGAFSLPHCSQQISAPQTHASLAGTRCVLSPSLAIVSLLPAVAWLPLALPCLPLWKT